MRLVVLPILALIWLDFLVGCQPGRLDSTGATVIPVTEQDEAQNTLTTFFDHLYSGRFADAVTLFGGSYESLVGWNPSVVAADHAQLLRNGCTINGLNCLRVRNFSLREQPSPDEYLFDVEFMTAEGDLFVLGPCCGGDETEQPPITRWPIRVTRASDGRFRVLDLPPYSP